MHVLLLLGLLTAVAQLLHQPFWARLAALSFVGFFGLVGTGILPRLLLAPLERTEDAVDPAWGPRNLIVLLGWDIVKWPSGHVRVGVRGVSRVQKAARLYRKCVATGQTCQILASSGDPTHLGRSEAAAMAELLQEVGIPSDDIRLESESNNTFQNAQASCALITERTVDVLVLVTSGFHVKRSLLYFAHFLDQPMIAAPADHLDVEMSLLPNALNFWYFDLAATEWIGIARYHVYSALGWNKPRSAIKGG